MNLIILNASPGLSLRPLLGEGTLNSKPYNLITLQPHNLITLKPHNLTTLQLVLLSAWDSDVISMRY